MIIGILTFYKTENFGANLQALSTYKYLEGLGHTPVCIYYVSENVFSSQQSHLYSNKQLKAHFDFVDKFIINQTSVCFSIDDVLKALGDYGIEGVIVGSDAVVQHHPLISRIYRGKRKPIYIEPVSGDRMFPNMFWGVGLPNDCKIALMSVSSQNSEYRFFSTSLKHKMAKAIERFSYISVRDIWTQAMFKSINGKTFPLTPDPVFAFENNVGDIVPSKDYICEKFGLPSDYLLVSLMSQTLSIDCLDKLSNCFNCIGVACVSLPMPTGKGFNHHFPYTIEEPLDPLDWYALIKYSYGYVGSNMHPIIVSLSNAVPCFSIDFWGTRNFWNRPKRNCSSKVEDIMSRFGLFSNHKMISGYECKIEAEYIFNAIQSFPKQAVANKSAEMLKEYKTMMLEILSKIQK